MAGDGVERRARAGDDGGDVLRAAASSIFRRCRISGGLVGLGILLCCALTLLLLPALLPRHANVPPGRGLTAAWLARFVTRPRGRSSGSARLATVALGAASSRLRIDTSIEKLQAQTRGAALEQQVARPVLAAARRAAGAERKRRDSIRSSKLTRASSARVATQAPSVAASGIGFLLPPAAEPGGSGAARSLDGADAADAQRDVEAAARARRVPSRHVRAVSGRASRGCSIPSERITYDGLMAHGLDSIVSRFIAHRAGRYQAVTYLYPQQTVDIDALATDCAAASIRRAPADGTPGHQPRSAPPVPPAVPQRHRHRHGGGRAADVRRVPQLSVHAAGARCRRRSASSGAPGCWRCCAWSSISFSLFAAVTFIGIAVDYGIYVLYRYVFEPSRDMGDVIDQDRRGDHHRLRDGAHRLRHAHQLELRAAARVRHRVARHADLLPRRRRSCRCRRWSSRWNDGHGLRADCRLQRGSARRRVIAGAAAYASPVVVVDDGSTDETRGEGTRPRALRSQTRAQSRQGAARSARAWNSCCVSRLHARAAPRRRPSARSGGDPAAHRARGAGRGDFVIGEREFDKDTMPAARFYSNVIGSADPLAVHRRRRRGFAVRFPPHSRRSRFAACSSLRTGYEIETEMLIKLARAGAALERVYVRRLQYQPARAARSGRSATPSGRACWRSLPVSFATDGRCATDSDLSALRWHAGGLNNGLIFGATYHGVTRLPRACSYAIGHVGTWLAYRLMRRWHARADREPARGAARARRSENCDGSRCLTYRSYGRDTIDFIRSLAMSRERIRAADRRSIDQRRLDDLLAEAAAASSSSADISATGSSAASRCGSCTDIR